jgi:hypothetical protein
MKIRHGSSIRLTVADNDEELSIEFDLLDTYLNYGDRRLMIADYELFDLLKEFMERH